MITLEDIKAKLELSEEALKGFVEDIVALLVKKYESNLEGVLKANIKPISFDTEMFEEELKRHEEIIHKTLEELDKK